MVMIIRKVEAWDEVDEALGGGGGADVTPAGDCGVPEETLTVMANFCPLEQCCGKVQIK